MINISVIIPTYNSSNTIIKAIDSVLNQSYKGEIELIVIDDGSTDQTHSVLQRYIQNGQIVYQYQENFGVSSARNRGIEIATGDYLFFLDSDDYLSENYFINFPIDESSQFDLVLGGATFIKADSAIVKEFSYPTVNYSDGISDTEIFEFYDLCSDSYTWGKLYKRQLVIEWEVKFDSQLSSGEDFLFHLNFFLKAKKICFVGEKGYFYRVNHSAQSLSNKILSTTTFMLRISKFDDLLKGHFAANLPLGVWNDIYFNSCVYPRKPLLVSLARREFSARDYHVEKAFWKKDFFKYFKKLDSKSLVYILLFLICPNSVFYILTRQFIRK